MPSIIAVFPFATFFAAAAAALAAVSHRVTRVDKMSRGRCSTVVIDVLSMEGSGCKSMAMLGMYLLIALCDVVDMGAYRRSRNIQFVTNGEHLPSLAG
jgi:hypothetical protein